MSGGLGTGRRQEGPIPKGGGHTKSSSMRMDHFDCGGGGRGGPGYPLLLLFSR